MRIAFVTPEYPPARQMGGIGTNAAALAPALARRGHEVVAVAPEEAGSQGDSEREGVRVLRLAVPHSPRSVPGSAITDRLLFRLAVARACRRLGVDVVHAAEWEAFGWAVTRTGVPVVTRLATPTHVVNELNHRGGDPATRVLERWERDQTRRSARVYAPTHAIVDRVAADWHLDPASVAIVPNPVDLDGIRAAAQSPPPFAVGDQEVVFIGRIERRKGVDTLAAALEIVMTKREDVNVTFIGREVAEDHGLAREIEARLAPFGERVRFCGELERSSALAVVARAAAVALPSVWESFGYVCVEAMATGRPVVASDTGGFSEIVDDGRTGFLVPVGDAAALAARLETALEGGPQVDAIRAAAARRAEDFAVDNIASRVEEILEAATRSARVDRSIFASGYRRHFRPDDTDPFAGLYAKKRDAVTEAVGSMPRQMVLDVGGGFGRISSPLAEAHDMLLCDLSSEMLAEAHLVTGGRVALVQADALALPFPNASVDGLVALDLLVHLPDVRAGLSELRRVVRPGGWLLIDSTNAVPGWVLAYPDYTERRLGRLLRTLRRGGVLPEWTGVVRHYRAREMRQMLRDAGLRLEGMEAFGPRWCPKWHVWRAERE